MSRSERRATTPEELSSIITGMETAEQEGLFEGLFSQQQVITVPEVSHEALIGSINPGMKLTKNFFLRIYGYEISRPGFKDEALSTLEKAGCSKARTYYEEIVGEYQRNRDKGIQPVAAAYVKELNEKWEKKQKGSEELRKQQIVQGLLLRSDKELLKLLQTMN